MVASAHDFFIDTRTDKKVHALAADYVNLIGFASGVGSPAPDCAKGPEVIKNLGLSSVLNDHNVDAKWKCILKAPVQNLDKELQVDYLSLQYRILAQEVADSIRQHKRFAVIGGDHSCAIGTWSGAAHQTHKLGPLGLIWIDAHMDSHTFLTSHSGALNGMPLACLLGYGDPRLTNIFSIRPKVLPRHICLVGVRSFETEEAQLLKRLGVRIFFMEDVKRRGLFSVLEESLNIVNQDTAGFGLSIDLDAIDPLDAPGVGTPELDGLSKDELIDALNLFPQQSKLLGVEITELNPALDQKQITAKIAIDLLTTCLVKS